MKAFPDWIVILIVVIVLARMAAFLARRYGLPGTSIQLLLGVLFGPSVFNLLGVSMVLGTWGSPSSGPLHSALKILAEIGLIQLMFLAGLEVDWRELKKTLTLSFSVGALGFVLTAVSVAIITRVFVDRWSEAMAMSAIVAASSFGISIYYFGEMKILGSRAAIIALGAAILSGLLAILLMIASQATNYAATYGALKMIIAVSWFLGKLVMFIAVAYFLTSRFLKLSSKAGFQKRPGQILVGYLLVVAALYAWAAMHFGSFAAIGVASAGGALLGVSNLGLKEKIEQGFQSVLASLPIGVLFVVVGMEANLKEMGTIGLFWAVLFVTVVGAKFLGCWIATRTTPELRSDGISIAIATLPQGEMGILIAAYLFSRGLVNPSSFNGAIIGVIVLTMLTPIVIKVAQIKFSIQVNVAPPFTGADKRHR